MIEQLCPELDLFKLLSDKLVERTKQNFDLKETVINIGKDLICTGKKIGKIPSLAADALSGLSKGKMKMNIELTGIDEPRTVSRTVSVISIQHHYFKYLCILA